MSDITVRTAMTKAELLAAAECAERYPKGNGDYWGYGPQQCPDVQKLILERSILCKYG